jgi:hypothetical protein
VDVAVAVNVNGLPVNPDDVARTVYVPGKSPNVSSVEANPSRSLVAETVLKLAPLAPEGIASRPN